MYFIIEGKAIVITPSDNKVIAILHKSDYFGEMGIISGRASTRTASVKAVTNLSLAILSIQDFNYICEEYPSIKEMVQKIAEERLRKNQENQKLESNVNIDHLLDSIVNTENEGSSRSQVTESEVYSEENAEAKEVDPGNWQEQGELDGKMIKSRISSIQLKRGKSATSGFPRIRNSVVESLDFNFYNFLDSKSKEKEDASPSRESITVYRS